MTTATNFDLTKALEIYSDRIAPLMHSTCQSRTQGAR